MIRIATIFMLWAFLMCGGVAKVVAQGNAAGPNPLFGDEEATKRIDDYLQLLNEGYSELEIFQDLGNANLLSENYDTAAFWFEKLIANTSNPHIKERYQERYEFASTQANTTADNRVKKDWTQVVMQDYREAPKPYIYDNAALTVEGAGSLKPAKEVAVTVERAYEPKLAISPDGKVAFFSRAEAQKPETGIFSKKEVVHVLYRAENVNGKWKNIQKVAVCPKYYSAMHPTLSADGTRLFFASNMPGSFGKYDIYVSEIGPDGTPGIAKNLGPKVNTKKNELYPSVMGGTTLLFASEGRKGLGGLDLFAVKVKGNRLGSSKNLGSRVNSRFDDFAIALSPRKGMGFVVSNRGNKHSVSQYAIAAPKTSEASLLAEKDEDQLLRSLNEGSQNEVSSTIFEDE